MDELSFRDSQEYWSSGPWSPFVRETRSAGSVPVFMANVRQPAGHYPDPPLPDLSLQITTRGSVRGRFDLGAGVFNHRFNPGDVFLGPAHSTNDYLIDGQFEMLVLSLPKRGLEAALHHEDGRSLDFGPLHAAAFRDDTVEAISARLWSETLADNPFGSLFADAAFTALGAALMRLAHCPQPREPRTSGLTPRQLSLVVGYMSEHLDTDLRLSELANLVGLSSRHLSRAFKASTGLPPYRWLLDRRLDRACELLRSSTFPIIEIALMCGFGDQSKLTHALRRKLGTTPAVFRRNCS